MREPNPSIQVKFWSSSHGNWKTFHLPFHSIYNKQTCQSCNLRWGIPFHQVTSQIMQNTYGTQDWQGAKIRSVCKMVMWETRKFISAFPRHLWTTNLVRCWLSLGSPPTKSHESLTMWWWEKSNILYLHLQDNNGHWNRQGCNLDWWDSTHKNSHDLLITCHLTNEKLYIYNSLHLQVLFWRIFRI